MSYTAKDIRNICLLGHGGDGKTILAEDMLFLTNGSDRLGSIADGNTVSDFDPEEIKRKYSISTSIIPVNFEGCKINLLDNPGFFDFAGEIVQSLRVADAGLIVLSAKGGIAVGTEKAWKSLKNANMPTMFYISKMDEDHANYYKVVDDMRATFGNTVVPLIFPMMKGDKCVGLVDLLSRTARDTEGNSTSLTPEAEERCEEYLAELSEQVAETSEEFMEKFFMEEPFTEEELIQGVKDGMRQRSITPVFCGSAMMGYGSKRVMEYIVKFCPNPLEGLPMATAEGGELMLDPKGSPAVFVFKTTSDQFGKNSYFKVISGDITEGMSVVNARTGATEKLSNIFFAKGKNLTKTAKVCCGDIGVATKLGSVKTGDTLGLAGKVTALKPMEYAEPCYTMAIYAKVKGQEDKIAAGLTKLNEEDASFRFGNNAETKQMVISGAGDIHLDVLCSKLKSKFGVEVELSPARVAYREKIRKPLKAHGRHKKQSGGHGQFGDVWIEFEPQEEQEDMIFAENVFGGSVPKNFFPAVEKGLRECCNRGVLAGYPMVYLKATLYDGSYHPVDSSEMAFKTAAGLAYKELINASPVILEPIGLLKVTIPDANMGDIMSDISSKRRGTVMGMNAEGGMQTVEAEVPMAEMSTYAIDLRSMTQGRGSFTLEFVRYAEAPANVQQKIIDDAKKDAEE